MQELKPAPAIFLFSMIKFKIILLFCVLSIYSISQNYIYNSSFEVINKDCIDTLTGFNSTPNNPIINSIYAIKVTPDIFNECAIDTPRKFSVSIPNNFIGYQWARTGSRMAGGWLFSSGNHTNYNLGTEIISFIIKDSLIAGNQYIFSFYTVRSNWINYSTDAMDAAFSSDSVLTNPDSVNYYYMITNRGKGFLKDTLNWIKITDTITANGKEKYVHIGKLKKTTNSNILYKYNPASINFPAPTLLLYYYDDVSLTPIDTIPPKSNAGNDTIICLGDSVLIGGHNYADYFYTWWNKDSIIHRDKHKGKIWVQPDTNTWYYCRATDFRYDKTVDSIFVQVYPCKAANYNTTICKGDTAGLGNGKEGFYDFTWSPDYFIDDIHSNTPIANPPQTTIYYANYKDSLGRTLMDSILIEVINCDFPEIINVYPVPTLNKITFEFNLPIPENTQIEIYDISGKLINFYTFDKYSNKRKAIVDLYNLEAGVYLYKIKYKQKVLFMDKLVKL